MSGEERNEQHANTDEQVPSSGENATFQAVANATDNIQSAFTTLLSGFQQKLQMTQSTIDLLEQVLKNSVQIATQLEPNEQGIQLTVTIINTIQMPVPDVQCCVTFDSDQVHWSHLSTTQESLSNNNNIKGGRNHEEATSIFDATEAMLPPLCKHVEVLQIITDRTIQCNAEIRLHFPGPVPETTIPIEHTFGIYIIDQLSKTVLTDQRRDVKCEKAHYRQCSTDTLRLLLQIPPHQGLEPGLCISLQTKNAQVPKEEIICKIEEFNQEMTMAKLAFSAEERSNSTAQNILEFLMRELDALNIQ